jgi:hypothetical protein
VGEDREEVGVRAEKIEKTAATAIFLNLETSH